MTKLNSALLCGVETTHGTPPPPPPHLHLGFSQTPENEREQRLTSAGWVGGWNRSRSPVSSFCRLTIFPPGRHSRSARLPEARAPSPSRTQVGNGGAIPIRQISHISRSPLCPRFSLWGGEASLRRTGPRRRHRRCGAALTRTSPPPESIHALLRNSRRCVFANANDSPGGKPSPKTSETGRKLSAGVQ